MYLRLLRPLNLFIVALTQYLLEFLLLIPVFTTHQITPALDVPRFLLLVLSTVLIAAGGYVINDIADREIDRINKPERRIIGRLLSVRAAWRYYFILFFVGFIISLYLAVYIENVPLSGIYPAAWLLLYWYSVNFKQRPVIGNVTVAVFCALVAGIVWFAERDAYFTLGEIAPLAQMHLRTLLLVYMYFAFVSTLYREIIKDLEDYRGDAENFCRTLPIVAGVKAAKATAFCCGLFFLAGLVWVYVYFAAEGKDTWFVLTFITVSMLLPLLYSLYLTVMSESPADYGRNSRLAKVLMLAGILLLFFF